MAISTAPQLRHTYVLWKRFSLPIEGGTRDAIAVPDWVAAHLNSAFTLMVTSTVMNLWAIVFAVAFFHMLRRDRVHHMSTSLWNKRGSLTDSFLEIMFPENKTHWRQWWVYPVIFVIITCWLVQNVLSIIIPSYILIDNAAPVSPTSLFAPSSADRTPSSQARLFSLDVPSALRAVGSAQIASSSVLSETSVTSTVLDVTPNGEPITRVSYSYNVTGADLGLQHYPNLLLSVSGACTTEYNWLLTSSRTAGYTNDTYALFGNPNRTISLSLYDGAAPIGYFYTGSITDPPGNITWAAYLSTLDRVSFSPSFDPFYYTGYTQDPSLVGTRYVVQPRRPVLSCWQTDDWWYRGRKSTITGLNSSMLPGLELSEGMQLVLARYLGTPKVVDIGRQLGLSALLSSTTALGSVFDAEGSSGFKDLERLIVAAYVATTNTLVDLTLYPNVEGRENAEENLVLEEDGRVKRGVDDFVVRSAEVSTLSVKAVIVISVLSFVFWGLALALLKWTPLRSVNALDAVVLHKTLVETHPEAKPHGYGAWNVTDHHSRGGEGAKGDASAVGADGGDTHAQRRAAADGVREIKE
ncbi:hypothetical protein OQA88_8656 [Cercophora sp. LCS_1]